MTGSAPTRLIGVGNSGMVHSRATTIADGSESGMSIEGVTVTSFASIMMRYGGRLVSGFGRRVVFGGELEDPR